MVTRFENFISENLTVFKQNDPPVPKKSDKKKTIEVLETNNQLKMLCEFKTITRTIKSSSHVKFIEITKISPEAIENFRKLEVI